MKNRITVNDEMEMEITSIDNLSVGDIFYHPVTNNMHDTRFYRALGVWKLSEKGTEAVRYTSTDLWEFTPPYMDHDKLIMALDVDHGSVVVGFRYNQTCMTPVFKD